LGTRPYCPLGVEHISAGPNYASDASDASNASVEKTSGNGATKQLLNSEPLRNFSQQGGHDKASTLSGCGITHPPSPPARHHGTDSSCFGEEDYFRQGFPPDGYRIVVGDNGDTSKDTDY